MIEIDDKIVSADLLRECFACDIAQCKGICCVEGNAGAPLEADEVEILEREYPNYKPYMTAEGIESVERQGFMVVDEDGDLTTPLVDDAQCAYTYTENGVTLCAIEKAWAEGKTPFRKPPVRRQAGHSGLQSPPGTDRPPFRRGILQGAGSRRRTDQATIRKRL